MEAWVRTEALCVERPDLIGGMYVSEYGDGVFPRETANPAGVGCWWSARRVVQGVTPAALEASRP